jgi:hypothetical protein
MAKFCTKCGKKLEEGQKCTCEKIKRNENIKEESINFNVFSKTIEDFLKKPFDKIQNLEDLNENSYLYLLCSALSVGLIGLNLVSGYFFNFFSTTVLSLLVLFLFSFILYELGISAVKENWNFKKVIDIVALSSIVLSVGNILGFLIGFISLTIELIVIIMSLILFMIFIYQGIISNSNIDKNKIGYLFVGSIFLTIICLIVIIRII